MDPIWATHKGPMWVLQQGFIWDPSGHIHMGPIWPHIEFGNAVAWWLMPRTPDPEVGGSSPTRVKPCCVIEQHLLPKKYW